MSKKPSIGIIGTGKVAQGVGKLLLQAEYDVRFGSREPERRNFGLKSAIIVKNTEAARSDIVILAVPYSARDKMIEILRNELYGKILINSTNPMGLDEVGRIISTLPGGQTEGANIAEKLPETKIVRAFTHIMDELIWSRATEQRGFWAMAYSTDHQDIKTKIESLIEDAGYVPCYVGSLKNSGVLDPGGAFFPHMFTPGDMNYLLKNY